MMYIIIISFYFLFFVGRRKASAGTIGAIWQLDSYMSWTNSTKQINKNIFSWKMP